jgi:hypothetical protein
VSAAFSSTPPGSSSSTSSPPDPASIDLRVSKPEALEALAYRAFQAGSASAASLESLKYLIRSIQVCEDMQPQGSGFQNPSGCLELYRGNESALAYDLNQDWTPLVEQARQVTDGYVDLMDADARSALGTSTQLTSAHVRDYNYGIITWALPVKLKASVALADGSFLYTHDGLGTSEVLGVDMVRNYFTEAGSSLRSGPAEEAVVLLPNGGNWFKFQQPLAITEDDVTQGRDWVLDLVFNPDGIVKGYEGEYVSGSLRNSADGGASVRSIHVPMLDLVPVPHRLSEHVVRESYVGHVDLGTTGFDVRLELYSVEGGSGAVLGVDAKSLVTAESTEIPPEMSKISYVTEADGGSALDFGSWSGTSIITGFQRVTSPGERTHAGIVCSQHGDPATGAGGSAIGVGVCPAALIDVEFTLVSRSRLDGTVTWPELDAGGVSMADGGSHLDAGAGPLDASILPDDASPVTDATPPPVDASAPIIDAAASLDASVDAQ